MRVDRLYPLAARLMIGVREFSVWRAAVEEAVAQQPAWVALSTESRRRFLSALWADLHARHHYRRWCDAGHPDSAPWYAVVARIDRGVARVTCPVCGSSHIHAPGVGKRYAPCGSARYIISLIPEHEPAAVEPR